MFVFVFIIIIGSSSSSSSSSSSIPISIRISIISSRIEIMLRPAGRGTRRAGTRGLLVRGARNADHRDF